MDARLELLTHLVEALSGAHTEASVVAKLVVAFSSHARVAWASLELDDGRGLRAVHASPDDRPVTLRMAPERHRETQKPRVLPTARDARHADLRAARRAGAVVVVVLPLADREVAGLAFVGLREALPPAMASTETLTLAAAIVRSSLSSCRALARTGEVSRRAHASSRELKSELARARGDDAIVARSRTMRRLLDETIPAVARRELPVLVRGESGSGKELVARRIHALSLRASRPLLAVNCGALPAGVIDSTLFGHEQGAFTGAHGRRVGIFERAHRGTLFLDEVGELPLDTQVKLLRVLQDGTVERIGGSSPVAVDVRVVAATHRDLDAMVAAGTFRLDLYHRLAVVPLTIPPLRERPEDIEMLASTLLAGIARRYGMRAPALSPADRRLLRAHDWPGNVRELANVLERAALFGSGGKLAIGEALGAVRPAARTATFADATRACIEAALAASAGRIHGTEGAAARLRLKPTTLQSKMRRLGITRPKRRR